MEKDQDTKGIILLVDDTPSTLQMVRTALKDAGYQVAVATDGEKAISRAKLTTPDLILMDVMMPGLNGYDTCKRLRIDKKTREIPVLFMSALTDTNDKIKAFQEGGVDYVTKPIETKELLARVETHIRLKRLQTELQEVNATLEKKVQARTEELSNANQSLKADRELFLSTLESIPGFVYLSTKEGSIRYANNIFKRLFGDPNQPASALCLPANAPAKKKILGQEWQRNAENSYMIYSADVFDRDGTALELTLGVDISEQKKAESEKNQLETQLRRAQKLEALGTLASGIAHDFNNILTGMLGYTEQAIDKVDVNTKKNVQADLTNVLQSGMRAKDLVKQILHFSRQTDGSFQPLEINLIVREVIKLLTATLPDNIQVQQSLTPGLNRVLADVSQMHQVVMNLCTNAVHAMKENGGVLSISTAEEKLAAPLVCYEHELLAGNYMVLTVKDTGMGIHQNSLQKIFEPYYTTKSKHEGTGLGLSVTFGIIQSHNGGVSVTSSEGKGTEFKIYLPTIVPAGDIAFTANESLIGGNERILFIDDEILFCELAEKILSDLGYSVTVMNSSKDALARFLDTPDQYDLLITDQTMPQMTGIELVKKLREKQIRIPVIICTGFSEMIQDQIAGQLGDTHILYKPVTKRDLAVGIRSVLD